MSHIGRYGTRFEDELVNIDDLVAAENGQPGFVAQHQIEIIQKRAAARQHDAFVDDVGSQLARRRQLEPGHTLALSGKHGARALTVAADLAYGAVAKPKEGTILSVARAAATAAEASASDDESMAEVAKALISSTS